MTHSKYRSNGAEIYAEEVGRGDTNGGEEKTNPKNQDDEGERLGMRESAVVKGEVGEKTGFFVGTVGFDEGAFVVGEFDESALYIWLALR